MEYKFNYSNEFDRQLILDENINLILIEEQNITEGNFLIFTDVRTQQENQETQDLNSRVSDISTYLSSSDSTTIADVENSILEIEKNKIINGGI